MGTMHCMKDGFLILYRRRENYLPDPLQVEEGRPPLRVLRYHPLHRLVSLRPPVPQPRDGPAKAAALGHHQEDRRRQSYVHPEQTAPAKRIYKI